MPLFVPSYYEQGKPYRIRQTITLIVNYTGVKKNITLTGENEMHWTFKYMK